MYEGTLEHAQFLARHFSKDQLQCAVGAMLFELKIPVKSAAFDYIQNAIIISIDDPVIPTIKGLYPTVGMMYNPPVGTGSMEQIIRSAVKSAWKERDDLVWSYYFQSDRSGSFKRPSNTEFVRAVMRFAMLWQGCCKEVAAGEK